MGALRHRAGAGAGRYPDGIKEPLRRARARSWRLTARQWTHPPRGRNVAAMNRPLGRRLVALAAAYAVALNALLPVLAAISPPAAIGVAVICSAGGAGSPSDSGVPEKPQPLCPGGGACAMPGCAAIALPNDHPIGARVVRVSAGLAGLGLDGRTAQTFWPRGRNLARAPPIV